MPQVMGRSTFLVVIALACASGANLASAQDTPSDMVTRLGQLEETVRNLTGMVQELQYRNQQLEQQVQRLQGGTAAAASSAPAVSAPPPVPQQRAAVSTALPPPSASQYSPPGSRYSTPAPNQYPSSTPYVPAPGPAGAGVPLDAGHDAFNPALHPNAPGAPHALGTSTIATEPPPPPAPGMDAGRQPGAPLNLSNALPQPGAAPGGALPPPPMANPSATGAVQEASLAPNASPKDEYDLAYGYVLHRNYDAAAQTFRDFLQKYPRDRLTPEAQYWLGESLFQGQKYHDAAEAFLTVSTKYETSGKAPDALLRLGESLAALGEKEAACASLGEVLRKYPHASISVKQNVDREQKRVHC